MSCLDSRHYVSISFKSVRYDRRAEGVSAESDVQNVSVSERKHKVFFPMDVLLGRVIHVVFCLQETCLLQTKDRHHPSGFGKVDWDIYFSPKNFSIAAITMARSVSLSMLSNGNPIANTR